MLVITTTQEVVISRIVILGQFGQKISETPSQQNQDSIVVPISFFK
jgi:hypothetical protein